MTVRPFYLPLVGPPVKNPGNAATYYQAIAGTVTCDPQGADGSMHIEITNSDQIHPPEQGDAPAILATVFAPTAGSVRYYAASESLPAPDGNPIAIPPTLVTPQDIGTLVIKVWVADYEHLMRDRLANDPRPNRILLGCVKRTSIEDAFSREVSTLPRKILEKAWEDSGGSGNPPSDDKLGTLFLQRLMAGTAELFVQAGTPLGHACLIDDAAGVDSNVAHLKLRAWFAPVDPAQPAQNVLPEELLENVLEDSGHSALFDGHPLLAAIDEDINVTFDSKFLIRDRGLRTFTEFANEKVVLKRNEDEVLGQATTDNDGNIHLEDIGLKANDVIWFELVRPLQADLKTGSHKARWYLDANNVNSNLYRAGYRIGLEYADFIDDITKNGDDEKFQGDRGNSLRRDRPGITVYGKGAFLRPTQREMIREMHAAEDRLNSDQPPNPAGMFTILIEGDSWLNYPLFNNDIYVHLYDMLQKGAKEGVVLNIFPFQHAGDRADQMFAAGTSSSTRQWDYTFGLLSQYDVDLIFYSGGGNDFAEPGISLSDKERYQGRFIQGSLGLIDYFDPFAPEVPGAGAPDAAATRRLLEISFASMLKSHRFNYAVRNDTEANYLQEREDVWEQLAGIMNGIGNLGENDPIKQPGRLQEIGDKVIAEVPERQSFPDQPADVYDDILATVYDLTRYRARFDSVKANIQRLMDVVSALHIPVLTHTYCYPLYNENPTYLGPESESVRITGPWFKPRFLEAGIPDRRVHKVCLKAMIDHYVLHILQPFTDQYKEIDPNQNVDLRFEYVDVRDWCMDVELWRDEMHLRSDGFIKIARELYHRIAVRFPHLFNP
jgi:hypothetical protein